MKRTLLIIMIGSLLASTAIYAQGQGDIACQDNEVAQFHDSRYFQVAGGEQFPYILADEQSIKIDKKNKTIKVWMIMIASELGRKVSVDTYSKFGVDYSKFGYTKSFTTFNYRNMKNNSRIIEYNCDGTVAMDLGDDSKWDTIIQGTSDEMALRTIMKKYKLK